MKGGLAAVWGTETRWFQNSRPWQSARRMWVSPPQHSPMSYLSTCSHPWGRTGSKTKTKLKKVMGAKMWGIQDNFTFFHLSPRAWYVKECSESGNVMPNVYVGQVSSERRLRNACVLRQNWHNETQRSRVRDQIWPRSPGKWPGNALFILSWNRVSERQVDSFTDAQVGRGRIKIRAQQLSWLCFWGTQRE